MDNYDWQFELGNVRLVEQMEPQPFRTFRTEFHMSSANEFTSTYTTTTHYSKQYTQTKSIRSENGTTIKIIDDQSNVKDEIDKITNGRPPDKHTTLTTITQDPPAWGQSMKFTEIKSLKRVHKVNEGIGTDNIMEIAGIMNPFTGEWMAIREAISIRVLDVRTGKILASPDGTQLTIDEAERQGLIQPVLAEALQSPCGVKEHGKNLTLLEAIQRNIYQAEQEALDPSKVTKNDSYKSGTYKLDLQHTEVKLQTSAVPLSDAVSQGLVDESSGWIVDRNTGNKYQVDAAIKSNVIDGDVREIVDPKTDSKLTVIQAIDNNIINPKLGKYVLGLEKITFAEAKRRQLIVKPKTLKDLVDDNLIEGDCILSPLKQSKLSLLEAVNRGVLDTSAVKSILDFRRSELITLGEALTEGIILPDCKFRNSVTGEVMSIPEAVSRGYIYSVVRKSIFDVDGFQPPDKSEFISFNAANAKGFISPKQGGSLLVDKKSGRLLPFTEGVKSGEVKAEVHDFLSSKIGIMGEDGELTVLGAVFKGYIDPKTGNLWDVDKKRVVYLNDAIAQHLITPEGASMLNSLLNLNVSTKVTKTLVQRYVTVTNKEAKEVVMTYTEALRAGLIDNERQTYVDPRTNEVISIVQAISDGKLAPDEESSHKVITRPTTTVINIVSKKVENLPGELPVEGWTLKQAIHEKFFDPVTGLFVIPGTDRLASLEECVTLKIINPSSAIVIDPTTKNKIPLTKAIHKKILDNTGHYQQNNEKIPMIDAIARNLILLSPDIDEEEGPSEAEKTRARITIEPTYKVKIGRAQSLSPDREAKQVVLQKLRKRIVKPQTALEKGILDPETAKILEETTDTIQEALENNKLDGTKGKIVDPQRGDLLNINEAISRGILDPEGTNDVLVPLNRSLSIPELFKQGLIDPDSQKVVHPETGAHLSIRQAIICDIVDPLSTLVQKTGDKVTLSQALDLGVVDDDKSTVETTKGSIILQDAINEKLFDKPKLGTEEIPPAGMTFPVALKRGLVNPETKEIVHPITKQQIPIQKAISDDFIMSVPFPVSPEAVKIEDALESRLIDPESGTFKDPKTGELIPIAEAVEQGLLVIKPHEGQVVTATTTTPNTIHIVTTKTVTLRPGYQLLSTKEVQNLQTGEIIPYEEALKEKIIVLEDQRTNVTTFSDALHKGLIDMKAGTYVDPKTGQKIPIKQAIEDQIISAVPDVATATDDTLNIAEAYERIYDEKTESFVDPEGGKLTFKEAVDRDIIDGNSIVYDVQRQKPVTVGEALNQGLLDPRTGKVKDNSTGGSVDFKSAAKKGLIAVLGGVALPFAAPILAVKAVKDHLNKSAVVDIEVSPRDQTPVTIATAIAQNRITPEVCNIIYETSTLPYTIQDGILQQRITEKFRIVVIDNHTVKLLDPPMTPSSGVAIAMAKATKKIVPNQCKIIYEGSTLPYTVQEGIEQQRITDDFKIVVIDKHTAKLLDAPIEVITIEDAISREKIQPKNCTIIYKGEKLPYTVQQGLEQNKIAPLDKIHVVDVRTVKLLDEVMTIEDGISRGKIEPHTCTILYKNTKLPYTVQDGVLQHLITPKFKVLVIDKHTVRLLDAPLSPVAIATAIVEKKIVPKQCNIVYEGSTLPYTVQEGLEQHKIADNFKIVVVDDRSIRLLDAPIEVIAIGDAISQKKIEPKACTILYNDQKLPYTIQEGLQEGKLTLLDQIQIVDVRSVVLTSTTVQEAISRGKIEPRTCTIVYKDQKLPYTVQQGLEQNKIAPLDKIKIVDVETVRLIDDIMTLTEAISRGLIELRICTIQYQDKKLPYTIEQGLQDNKLTLEDKIRVVNAQTVILLSTTVQEAITQGLIEPKTCTIWHQDQKLPYTIHQGLQDHKLTPFDKIEIVNVKTVKLIDDIITINDAISRNSIEPKICTIEYQDKKLPYTIEQGLQDKKLTPSDKIQVITPRNVKLLELPHTELQISRQLTPYKLAELGYYDLKAKEFFDPKTGRYVTFEHFVYDLGVLDPDKILVKDLKKKTSYVSLDEALRRLLIDPNTGYMVDPKTGKKIPFFECLKLRWIIHVDDAPKAKYQPLTLTEIVDTPDFNPSTIEVKGLPLIKAITSNLVDPKSVTIKDPRNMQLVPYYEAVDKQIVDPQRGLIINTANQRTMKFEDGFTQGFVLGVPRPMSLQAIIVKGYYDVESGMFKDKLTKQLIGVKEAVERQIIDDKISEIKDVKANHYVTLDEALTHNLMGDEGVKDTKTGQLIPYDKTLNLKLIQTKPVVFNLLQAILQNYYNPKTGKFLNPITGDEITLQQAIEVKLIDPETTRIKDDKRGRIVEINEAIQSKLVDAVQGLLTNPILTLDQAYLKGYILSTVLPWSLQETLAQNVYNPKTGQFTINNNNVNLLQAIEGGIVNPNILTVKDPRSGDIITLNDAIKVKIIDPVKGQAFDPLDNVVINFLDAQDKGLIVPYKTQITLPEAVFKGFYDPNTGKFINPKSKERLKAESAINRGYVDTGGTLVTIDEEIVTFEQAVIDGIINTSEGVVISERENIDFNEAFERGLLVEVRPPIPLSEAIAKGIYDKESQMFLDPQTGSYLTLIEAIEIKLIDAESVSVKDTRVGIWRKIPLVDAILNNYVDGNTGQVRDFSKGDNFEVTLEKAFDLGILIDNKAAHSLQRAIHQGLYDEVSGKILDPSIDRKVTLHEAIRKFNINPLLPCYFDKRQGVLYNLTDACRMGIIDKLNGTFKVPHTDEVIKLSEALQRGLIVDIESANFGLYEAIDMGFYLPDDGLFIHPATGRKFTLQEACENELINPVTSLIKNTSTNKYLKLPDAIDQKIIDDQNNKYIYPHGKTLDLQDAKNKGLIVTSFTPLTVEEAILNKLYRPESGKFADPVNGEYYDLKQALKIKFIDPQTTALRDLTNNTLKSLPLAIEQGKIDVERGRVLDSKSKKPYNFEDALKKGLLVTLDTPLEITPVLSPQNRECTLEEAIKFDLLNPNIAVTKDLQTGRFKTITDSLEDKQLDPQKTLTFEPQNSRIIIYDENTPIYISEPLTFSQALDKGYLNVNTGKFTDPQSNQPLSLKDSITQGYIDPDSVLIKDANKKKLIKLPEGFRKGLIDADKGNVLDTATSKLHTMPIALDTGLLITPNRGFTLIEGITYGIYNPTTGCFTDPFTTTDIINRKKITLANAIQDNLIDPSSTVVKDTETGAVRPLLNAIQEGLVDPQTGKIQDKLEKKDVDFQRAHERGLLLPADQWQAVEEKYRVCDDTLTKLLQWITDVENRIANQDVIHEVEEELRNQINTMKQIRDDLDQHTSQVAYCGEQVRQLVLTAGDILSKSDVSSLESSSRKLKTRFDTAVDRTGKLLSKLMSSRDELSKLRGELKTFSDWLGKARRILEDKESALSDLRRLDSNADGVKEFVSDVIAHQADLRFITISAQKFVDEGKEYLTVLNNIRTSMRLHNIEPLSSQESPVRKDVSLVTQQYRDLLHRANNLSDRLSGVGGMQRGYSDALDKARQWLQDAEPRAIRILNEPIGGDPKAVEDQLAKAKTLNNEFVANGRLIDNAKQATNALLRSLEGQISPSEMSRLEEPVIALENKYNQLSDALANRCQELDTALVQSQGVQDGLDSISEWLNQAENTFKNMQRPASLIKERLDEQLREHRVFQSDIDSHIPSIDSIQLSASELISSSSNARISKQIESKLNDVKSRFEKLFDRAQKRGVFLEETNQDLTGFNNQASEFERWYGSIMEMIDSRDFSKLSIEEYAARMGTIAANRDSKQPLFEEAVRLGKDLLNKRDVTDTSNVRDRVKTMETQWRELSNLLDEKARLSKLRSEQLNQYESLREQVLDWLSRTETRISRLEIVAVDIDILKKQNEELKPIAKDYKDFAPTIDKINDVGTAYDNLIRSDRPDSPSRRRGAFSPTKRRLPSQDGRSPSPTKGLSPLSTGGSSGFSSRRSSQDGFHLEESSPVQQQLSEINNRYSLIGAKINDRQSEIDSTREELKKHLDNLRTLSAFLDKVQRQLPKDIVPGTKEEADKLNRQIKQVLEEMYEKQSLLDSTKSQVKDLLRRKPGAIGADNLNDELEDVVSHWKSISDHLKNRIKFMEDMKQFHDTHDSLSSWLSAKDRMLTVLGPISSDPRMVQSQVQQVQVLREEFRTQQPQLQHLINVGDSVLSYLQDGTPDHQKINNKLTAIQQRWADLLGKLEERADSLGAAADTSREFDAQLTRLRDALQGISDNLDELPLDKDPEEQLRKVENLERQLEGQRPLLADLEAAGAHLCDVLSDPASKADIQAKLAQVGRQYNALQKKLDHKKAELEGSLRDGRQFEETCAKTLGWLADELGSLSEKLLVSANRDVLEQQLSHHEPIYRDVLAREHEVIMLLNKGRDILAKSTRSDTRTLQRDIDKIQQQWDKLRKEAVERHTRLQTCKEHCRKYYKALETFLPWLRQAEDKLDSLRPSSFQRKHIEKQLKELQNFRNDVWKKSGEYENTRTLGDTFVSACDIDKEVVKNELQDLKERWDRLNNDLIERTQALEDQSRKLSDFNENVRDLKHGLERCEDKLASHDALGGAARDPKLLDRIKALREDTGKLKKPLQVVRQQADDLVNEASQNGIDANHLRDEVDSLADRLDELTGKLDDRCSQLQSAATAVTQFNDKVKGLSTDLSGLENELDNMKPPGREVKVVREQIDEVGRFLNKLNKVAADVNEAINDGERLVDSGFAPDTAHTRQQVETLKKQLGKLDDRAQNREKELENVLKKLEDFYMAHSNAMEDLNEADGQVRKLKPVASDVDNIRAQQQDFKKLRAKLIEPLAKEIEACNKIGQNLVQTAGLGVNTANLEKDLEKMNELWNNLKQRMNDRERRLDVALLQCGKFQEALDGLAKWLTDTEDLVANQKPPSADYKVVKAQLQEQKCLKKLLLDRQDSMSSLFGMGNDIAKEAEPAERKAIEKQLKNLMGRFDALTQAAQQRTLDLEQAMHVAKQFEDKLLPLQDWLDKTEKKVKDMEVIPTDEEKIQKRIREHGVLHNEILDKKPDFRELADIASNLMSLVGDDEAAALTDKLQDVTDRYGNLVEASEHIGELLNASRQGLRHLVLTYQDLAAWMDQMEQRLARYKVLAVHKDKLLEQMDDLTQLTEEIANRQGDVDGTVDAGVELMRHISSDEALQLKDKLDSLQRRYNDLTSKGADLLKQAETMLPLVQAFHEHHNHLVDWMQGAESILQSAEPRESDIVKLEMELQELRPVLEKINIIGPKLCQVSPGEGAATIEGLVSRDNRRFDAIAEQIQRRAERITLGKQRALEVTSDIDELLDWFREVENQLRDADKPSAEPDLIRVQLKEHKALNDDISSQRGRVRDVLATAKKVLRESPPSEDMTLIREKMEDLRETMDTVSSLSSDRLGILEQALQFADHFHDTHNVLANWLDDMEEQVALLAMPSLRPDLIAQQQDRNEMFLQSINEHKPLLDKLNKTGEALIRLCNDDDGSKVQELLDNDNARYQALRLELRERQEALEKAMQDSSQFSDKLEGMLRALNNTADQLNNLEPISAHVPKIKDQIEDNNAFVDDLDKRKEAYAAVKRAADDVINKAGNRADPAIKDIKRKLDKLKSLWDDVQKVTSDRGRSLDDALEAAKKFWHELHAIMATLKDLEDSLISQEPPAVEPKKIQQQQVALQEIRNEIDQTKPDVDKVRNSGKKLMQLCGEPDKPEVKKNIEDLENAWDNITALYAKREENLIDAMEKAMEFHETLQNLLAFLEKAENKFNKMGPLGADIEQVKKQIDQLNKFKAEVDPHMVKVEALNRSLIRQAQELTERTSADQASAIKEPLNAVNKRWDNLLRGIVERQRQLENALLRLGQFQHALNELLVWIKKTDRTLDELKPVAGDPQILEVELAKLKVLINDIQAHQTSVDTLNDAGRQIIESGEDEASVTQDKLNTLNTQWRALMQKAADRQRELEDALTDAQRFNGEIQDLLNWLGDVDGIIAASKPVGGLPETASEQLERFMEVYNEIEDNRPKVETILAQGQEYLKRGSNAASNLQHNLRTLKQRWDSVTARANDKKIKLEIALKEATEFHESLQAFVDWLTNAEKILSNLKPVSRVLETIQEQMEEHKIFQKDVNAHREIMLNLDKKGTHLKYFSQKQDVILIKNLLISVQHRWDRVASKSSERTRALDLGYKEAKEFHDAWAGLMNWLDETEHNLDELVADAIGNNPEKIKSRLAKHQEFQRAISAKQGTYDNVMKTGKQLKDKAPKGDEPVLKQMLIELKNKWNSVCNKSVDRQRKLEEALLYSGQFKDAIKALLDWLKKAKKDLSADSPVHGDLDTVNHLVELHRVFEGELERRNAQMESVIQTGQELERKASSSDSSQIRGQLVELNELWESVTSLTYAKTDRLKDALREAERLHKSVNMILDWLSEAEHKLRFVGSTPEDEATAYEQLRALDEFRAELSEKEIDKNQTLELAHSILAKAHPDSINTIKNWIKVIQSRWDEVSQWALQRHQKLTSQMQSLRDLDESLEELIRWLLGLENTLIALKREELPMTIPETEELIEHHKEFMENTQKRQSEVDRICKAKQIKAAPGAKDPKKFAKGKPSIRGSQHDIREQSPDTYGSLGRKQSFKGSRDLLSQRGSRASPGRELSPDPNLPHYGPRFPAGSEPEFRSPRVKFLYDKWRHVWVLSWERQRELYDHLAYLKEKEKADNFSWDDWRKRFLKFMNYKKSRLTDLFRKMDKDNNELIPREDFIDGIIKTKFDTSRLEMKHVADMFDLDNRGLIDWKKFIAALRPDWEEKAPDTDAQKIHDEVKRLVMLCTCRQRFKVLQVGEGKYRFGESQKLRLVRILRSTVMVRVGGGWVALDEFLLKNDPCRAKGRTNIELREQFILADGVSQTMTAFKSKPVGSSPASGSSQSSLRTPQGPITKVRERSQRSVPMGSQSRIHKSSMSAGTPDSLSDNESSFRTPRRPSYRSNLTPGGSRNNSRPASRTGSRPGSKPPSRYGSNQSLDSVDDATPSRIPRRTPTTSGRASSTLSSARKTYNGGTPGTRTPSGLISPASPATRSAGISRASSIPTLTGFTTNTRTKSSASRSSKSKIPISRSTGKLRNVTIATGPNLRTAARTRTPSGSNTPVSQDQQTAVSRLLRGTETPSTKKKSTTQGREPFRL